LPVLTSDERAEVRELADALTGEFATWLRGSFWMTSETAAAPPSGAHVLRSMLRARGERLRLEVALEAPEGGRLWSGKHDGALADGFDWQDETAEAVVGEVFAQLLGDLRRRQAEIAEREADARQLFLKALLTVDASSSGWAEALRLLELASDRDPDWALPRAAGAGIWFSGTSSGGTAIVAPWTETAQRWIDEARRLAPEEARTGKLGVLLRLACGGEDAEASAAEARNLLRRMPFDQDALFWASWVLLYAGEPETARPALLRARRILTLSFYEASTLLGIAHASVQMGDDAAAVRYASESARLQPDYGGAWRCLAAAQAHLGDMDAARAASARLLEIVPGDTVSATWARARYPDRPGLNRYREGLLKAGVPE
jgi:adenylate cyclase